MTGMIEPQLRVSGLSKHFPIFDGFLRREVGHIRAVDDVSFDVAVGETLGIVGESGCGKSTMARCILRLIEPTRGHVSFRGRSITRANRRELRALARDMQIVFQDPYASLDPRMSVASIIGEALIIHGLTKTKREYQDRIAGLLETVGLSADLMRRFPHEFSGGQRQRIGIARALAVAPRLIICDEPTSALDVSTQAQVINLFEDLQAKLELTYLFIAHDLSVVKHVSDRVAVMYLGRIVEMAPVDSLYGDARHPYTEALLSAVPVPDPNVKRQLIRFHGEIASTVDPPSGCHFHPRCPISRNGLCDLEVPKLKLVDDAHWVACHLRE